MDQLKNMKQETERYQALVEELLTHSAQAVVLLNTEAEIIFCSQTIAALTGYEPGALLGKTVFDFFHLTGFPAAWKQYLYFTKHKETASVSLLQLRNSQGHLIWVDAVVKNLLDVQEVNALLVLLKKNCDAGTEERKLVQAVTAAREQEREWLATELHDNVNQIITATKLLVDAARLTLSPDELLRLASVNLQSAADEIRKLSYSMVGFDLQEEGLAFAVDALLATISRTGAVTFRATFDEAAVAVLTADQQRHVYRLIQEGVNNIIKHAAATHAEIALTRQEELIYLVMADNGKGFSGNSRKPGVGLASMTNRVKLLGGHYHVRAPEGQGTTIEIHFPV
jgi:PAS domain S-box-containing protein